MSDARKTKRLDRSQSRLLNSLAGRLESYMGRFGLMAFAAEPGGDAGAGGAPAGGDAAAGGDAGAGAGGSADVGGGAPAGDKPAGDAAAGAGKPDAAASGDQKPGDKPAADKPAGDGKDGKPAGAPEAYTDFTLPENIKLDESVMGEFQQLAKEHGLTQEAAQKFVSLGAKMQEGNAQAIHAAIEKQGTEWGQAAMADKEIGGEKFTENVAVAKAALDKFGTPELKAMLVQSKLGNHPEVLRTFFRVGQAISQDGFAPGRQGVNSDPARVLFPSMN